MNKSLLEAVTNSNVHSTEIFESKKGSILNVRCYVTPDDSLMGETHFKQLIGSK